MKFLRKKFLAISKIVRCLQRYIRRFLARNRVESMKSALMLDLENKKLTFTRVKELAFFSSKFSIKKVSPHQALYSTYIYI